MASELKRSTIVETILQRLTDLDDVLGAILVGKDGLIVTGTLHSEDEEVIGAMSAAAFGSITNFISQMSSGAMHRIIIETENSTIQLEEVGDLILVVSSQAGGNMGRIRLEMKKACRQILQLVANY
jgi:predicted regulator of Ras-like GTPase activity (Roadblock/LC7/MglB family)